MSDLLHPHEVRSLCAARIAAVVTTLSEMSEPYFLARRSRSPVHLSFAVGLGRSSAVEAVRQAVGEGVLTETQLKVLVAYQLEHTAHVVGETEIGELRAAVIAALCADWSSDFSVTWVADPEISATATTVWFETEFLVPHHRPLE